MASIDHRQLPNKLTRELPIEQALAGVDPDELPEDEVEKFVELEKDFERRDLLKEAARELLDEEDIRQADRLLWIDQCEVYSLCQEHYRAKSEGAWTGFSEHRNFREFQQQMRERLEEGVPCVDCKQARIEAIADEIEDIVDVEVSVIES